MVQQGIKISVGHFQKFKEFVCFSLLEFASCGSYSTLKAKMFGFCIRAKFLEKQAGKLDDRVYGEVAKWMLSKEQGATRIHDGIIVRIGDYELLRVNNVF
ncbi:hypothetical protein ARALYDRAFT_916733 [Arabidopsis lyrata subsp. lyrata]|uniref:Uncharacterized protein n=1 Tax=Arabidopsis lyrata subsp. lyrata TaxID=81972 RepID=D7MQN0_ARALL|nr:hypothetical protein ARALYDRAFT_916733 [Arabidopsis lyrata subsp. lyrata]